MRRRLMGLAVLSGLLFTFASVPASVHCLMQQMDEKCCCPEKEVMSDCHHPSREIGPVLSCCRPVEPSELPGTSAIDRHQVKKVVSTFTTVDAIAPAPTVSTPRVEAHDMGPPAVPLYTLHAAFLI